MATVIPKYNKIIHDQPQQAFYMVSIDTSGFLDTETNNGGRISPCVAEDFATAPTTLAQSRLVSRGALRFKKMLELLQVRSNVSLRNVLTTYASDAGDNPITKLQFGLVYDNDNFIPTTGTAVDGSTTTSTKVGFIKDKITEALMGTFTERMQVFNPTSGAGLIANEDITAAPVLVTSTGEVLDAVTVTEALDTATMVSGFRPTLASQLPTDNADNDTAE
jgi:hypothetical protein|tara:strand:- start:614 stop:1273 length:660 start_codon:yes stop_codon:yes gene_type:complete